MFKLSGIYGPCAWECEAGKSLSMEQDVIAELLQAVATFKAMTPTLRLILIDKTATDYNYRFELADGRVWRQNVTIPASGPVAMDFRVTDKFTVAEYAGHRPVRDLLVSAVQDRKLSLFRATWS